ncbi:MAG: peptide-methionine (S)-S-oxide reductase MsrA [Gammaproteobacteria bacterium]
MLFARNRWRLNIPMLGLCMLAFSTPARSETAVFAGGCFWCMEAVYQEQEGVTDVVSGFTGGTHPNPTYKGDHTGHYEAVLVSYDPAVISYQTLLDLFWVNIDPFDGGGQFCDRGPSYRPALFVATKQERQLAEASLQAVINEFPDNTVRTPLLPRAEFFPVVESHQDYYQKNPIRYRYYRYGCGRDKQLDKIWGTRARGASAKH